MGRLARVSAAVAIAAIVTALAAQSSAAADPWADAAREIGLERVAAPGERPMVRFADGDGNALDLGAFAGRVVLVNLWATWCAPCVREMPALDRLEAKLGGPDFAVVAISIDRSLDLVNRFFADTGITHLTRYIDPKRRAHVALGAQSLPFTVLLDREGRVRGRVIGPAEWDSPAATAVIRTLIEGAPAPPRVTVPWWPWAAGVAAIAGGSALALALGQRNQRVGTGVSPE